MASLRNGFRELFLRGAQKKLTPHWHLATLSFALVPSALLYWLIPDTDERQLNFSDDKNLYEGPLAMQRLSVAIQTLNERLKLLEDSLKGTSASQAKDN